MTTEKEYFAFISYKREDEKWAKWLQHKLEHYKLPSNLNGKTDLPKEIRPVFRDKSELAGGVLAEEINQALTNSKFLIVICSPRAAHSQWVDKEVQTFINWGRTDQIIPFIIEGTAHSQKLEDECFPKALLDLTPDQELLGINIDEMGRDAAAVKVVAQMFGLKFDALWHRYEREQRSKRGLIVGGALLFAIFSFGIGGYFIKQNRIIEKQNNELEYATNNLKRDSIIVHNHMIRIQQDSILLWEQSDSLEKVNLWLKNAIDTITIINDELAIKQAEIVGNYGLELLKQGNPTDARNLVIDFLCKNQSKTDNSLQLECLLRQLYFLDYGIGERLVDKIRIQSYEEFVEYPDTRVLSYSKPCFYFYYDCNLLEYNTKKHTIKKIFDGNNYIDYFHGSIDAFSPLYNKVYLTLPKGDFAVINIITGRVKILDGYKKASIQINPEGSLGLIFRSFVAFTYGSWEHRELESKFQLWDISNDKVIEEHGCTSQNIHFVSNNIIEVQDSSNKIFYYRMPGYILLNNFKSQIESVDEGFNLVLDDTTNIMYVYRGTNTLSPCQMIGFDSTDHKIIELPFLEFLWDKKTSKSVIPHLPNSIIPESINPWSYILSPNNEYAIIQSHRGSLYLVNILKGQIIRCLSDFKIMEYELCALFWDSKNQYVGFSSKQEDEKQYEILILNIKQGNVVLRFHSDCFDTFFSQKGDSLIHAGQKMPFPRYDELVRYFTQIGFY